MDAASPVSIRVAEVSDGPRLARLYLESADHHVSLDPEYYVRPSPDTVAASFRQRLVAETPDRAILIAEIDAECVGSVEIDVREPGPGSMIRPQITAWLGIVVRSARRGQGIGQLLMREAEAWAAARGATAVMVDVSARNGAAIEFYRGLGYATSGLLMRKRLDR